MSLQIVAAVNEENLKKVNGWAWQFVFTEKGPVSLKGLKDELADEILGSAPFSRYTPCSSRSASTF